VSRYRLTVQTGSHTNSHACTQTPPTPTPHTPCPILCLLKPGGAALLTKNLERERERESQSARVRVKSPAPTGYMLFFFSFFFSEKGRVEISKMMKLAAKSAGLNLRREPAEWC